MPSGSLKSMSDDVPRGVGGCARGLQTSQRKLIASQGACGLTENDGAKCMGLANVSKNAGGFAKGLHSSLRTSADLQRACKGHDKF